MSQRERWIIYPLLFFCFSMCIKLYWYPHYEQIDAAGGITCRNLLVKDENNRTILAVNNQLGRTPQLVLFTLPPPNAPGKSPIAAVRLGVSPQGRGVVESLSEFGAPMVELSGDTRSGTIRLFDPVGRSLLTLHKPSEPQADDPRAAPVRPPVPPAEPTTPASETAVGSSSL